jgi:hypothetical protein
MFNFISSFYGEFTKLSDAHSENHAQDCGKIANADLLFFKITVIFPGQNAKTNILFLRSFLSRYFFPFSSNHFYLKLRILTATHPPHLWPMLTL